VCSFVRLRGKTLTKCYSIEGGLIHLLIIYEIAIDKGHVPVQGAFMPFKGIKEVGLNISRLYKKRTLKITRW
jgi:hypothetical protein